jgi:ABC-2 type transport system ATP-binding protein
VLEDPAQVAAAAEALAPLADGEPAVDGPALSAPLRAGSGGVVAAVRRLDEAGVRVQDIAVRRPTLDDAFLTLTGRPAEEAPTDGEDPA